MGSYRSCAVLLAISNPLMLNLVWYGVWVCTLTCEFVCGVDETFPQKKEETKKTHDDM